MKLGRRLCLLCLLLLTSTVFWASFVLAQTAEPGTQGGNGPIGSVEAVKCDELSDEQKKEIAKEAYNHLAAAEKLLKEMAQIITEDIYPDNGVCHFVYARDWGFVGDIASSVTNFAADVVDLAGGNIDGIRVNGDGTADQSGTELTFSSNAKKGAEYVDGVLTPAEEPSGTAVAIINRMESSDYQAKNGEKEGLKSITDWDMRGVYEKAKHAVSEAERAYNWIKTSPPNSFIDLDRATSNFICQQVECHNGNSMRPGDADECDRFYKHSDCHMVCMDAGDYVHTGFKCDGEFPSSGKDGRCRDSHGKEIPCKAVVSMGEESGCWRAISHTWTNGSCANQASIYGAFKKDVLDGAPACLTKLETLAKKRGDVATENTFIWHRKEAKHRLAMLSGETQCSCTKNDKGEIEAYCQDEAKDEDNKGKDCKTIGEYQAELADTCPTCELLATIAAAAQNISKGAFNALASDLIALVGIGLLIYIGYVTLLTVASPEAQKISKYLMTILIQGFKVAITILILQNPTFLYKEVLSPILSGSIDLSTSLMSTPAATAATQGAKYASKFDGSNEFLDAKMLQNLVGVADTMNREVTMMPAIGRSLICHSFDPKGLLQKIASKFVPFPYRFAMFIEGAILYIFGYLILLALIAYMLDCMVELGLVCAIMAFCVACWPFKLTSNYTKVGWNMFLNVFFNFVMMGVVVTAITNISTQTVSGGMDKSEFEALVNGDNVDALAAQINIGGLQMLVVLICSMICLKLPKEVGRLANKFAGGAQISIGSELAGAAAQVATKAAIGGGLQKGADGKRHLGGAAGLLLKGAKGFGGSVAEHSGLKGAANAAGRSIKNKAQGVAGRIGLGAQARMASKGRDAGANKNTSTDSQFKQDR